MTTPLLIIKKTGLYWKIYLHLGATTDEPFEPFTQSSVDYLFAADAKEHAELIVAAIGGTIEVKL